MYFHVKKKKLTFREPLLTLSSEWPSSTVDIKRAHGTDEVPRTDCWVYLHILQTRQRHKVRERERAERQRNRKTNREPGKVREREKVVTWFPPSPQDIYVQCDVKKLFDLGHVLKKKTTSSVRQLALSSSQPVLVMEHAYIKHPSSLRGPSNVTMASTSNHKSGPFQTPQQDRRILRQSQYKVLGIKR